MLSLPYQISVVSNRSVTVERYRVWYGYCTEISFVEEMDLNNDRRNLMGVRLLRILTDHQEL